VNRPAQAHLNRAPAYEAGGGRFESCIECQIVRDHSNGKTPDCESGLPGSILGGHPKFYIALTGGIPMRLAIARSGFYRADKYCSDSRSARRALREHSISILAIEYYLAGSENGDAVLRWAGDRNLLPFNVVIIERDRTKRKCLSEVLTTIGFRSSDETTYFKL